jgi:uncharacterized membrane protein HdeD (DUF308 family)
MLNDTSFPFMRVALPDFHEQMNRLHENWGWLMAMGVVLLVFGIVCLAAAGVTTLSSVLLFGALLAIGGAMQIIHAFSFRVGHGFFLNLLAGVLYTVLGVLMLARPAVGAVSLTLLLAGFFLAGGIFRCIWSVATRYPSWGWSLFSGIVTTALGFYIAANIQTAAIWLIGTVVGVEMIFSGWSWIMLAGAAHSYRPVSTRIDELGVDAPRKVS